MNPLLGIVLKVVSALSFTLMSAGIKLAGSRYPTGEVVFFRSAFALVPLLAWLTWGGELGRSLRTRNVLGHLKRGLMGASSMFCGFAALSFLPLPNAVALGYLAPLIVVVLAALVLKERVGPSRWLAVAMGFGGVIVMLAPQLAASIGGSGLGEVAWTGATLGMLFALGGACCTAGAMVEVRRLISGEKTGAIVFYFSMMTTMLGLSTVLIGNWVMPSLLEVGLLAAVGILGGIGQILLTQSYRYADASLIAPFEYTSMIWACILGWLAFGELPVPPVLFGAGIVMTSGIFLVWRERHDAARAPQLGKILAKTGPSA